MFATPRTVSDNQVCSTRFRVVGMETLVINAGDGNGIDAVRITVKVTLVLMDCSVSTRVNENGAFPTTPVGDTVHDGFFNEITGGFHCPTIIWGSPATAVDRGFLEAEVKSSGLVNIGDGRRQYPDSRDFGVPGDAHATCIIFNSTDLAGAASPVMVVKQFGGREVLVPIEVVRALGPLSFRSR